MKKIIFLNVCLLSFYAININSLIDMKKELKVYSEVNPGYARILERRLEDWKIDKPTDLSSIQNDHSPFVSKDRVPEELLMKAAYVFNYINYLEQTINYFVTEKSEVHKVLAKIAQPKGSSRKEGNRFSEESYKEERYDTTLTQKELEYITQWFNERYDAIKDKGLYSGLYDSQKYYEKLEAEERKLEAQLITQQRVEALANIIKFYRSLKNQDYLKNWHPYQRYWNKKYKISDFEKALLDSNPFL